MNTFAVILLFLLMVLLMCILYTFTDPFGVRHFVPYPFGVRHFVPYPCINRYPGVVCPELPPNYT